MTTKSKPKFAMYWAAACGGCEIATLNIHEKILDFDAHFEPVFWPVAMDGKVKDVEALPDQSILLTLFNGGIRNDENEEMARLLRRKSQLLVAFGSCACQGGIPGLANLNPLRSIFDTAYHTVSTDNSQGICPGPGFRVPEGDLHLPTLYPVLKTLGQVVPVDYNMPGCPPESGQIATVIDLVIGVLQEKAQLPPKGATIGAGVSTLCDECPRKRDVKKIAKFVRIQEMKTIDAELCLLEQGIPCNGPATRNGCGAVCPKANAQCIGCYGPAEGVVDFGTRLMSAFASVVESKDPQEISRILDGLPDPAGQFYRFNLAGSLLRASKSAWKNE
ncbi:MAG TPA: oxidoreductase [Thermodesulfobacteriota bacterium]|nr:oxidoreductase [Thermodesulfobacteriota bacterium]